MDAPRYWFLNCPSDISENSPFDSCRMNDSFWVFNARPTVSISPSTLIELTSHLAAIATIQSQLNNYHQHDVAALLLTCAFSFSAKGRSGEVCLALLLCTQPRLLSLWPERNKRIPHVNGCDSDAEQKRSFLECLLQCESSDLGRGMFEVAPRSAACHSVSVPEERVWVCGGEM